MKVNIILFIHSSNSYSYNMYIVKFGLSLNMLNKLLFYSLILQATKFHGFKNHYEHKLHKKQCGSLSTLFLIEYISDFILLLKGLCTGYMVSAQ